MADVLPARHQPNLRRQALSRLVAWDADAGVHIIRFPSRLTPEQAASQARYQAQFDHPITPLKWAPTRLERSAIRFANRVRALFGRPV